MPDVLRRAFLVIWLLEFDFVRCQYRCLTRLADDNQRADQQKLARTTAVEIAALMQSVKVWFYKSLENELWTSNVMEAISINANKSSIGYIEIKVSFGL